MSRSVYCRRMCNCFSDHAYTTLLIIWITLAAAFLFFYNPPVHVITLVPIPLSPFKRVNIDPSPNAPSFPLKFTHFEQDESFLPPYNQTSSEDEDEDEDKKKEKDEDKSDMSSSEDKNNNNANKAANEIQQQEDNFKNQHGDNWWGVSFGLFDRDEYLDMVAVDMDKGVPFIFVNNGSGFFTKVDDSFCPSDPFEVSGSLSITASLFGDFDDDKLDDLVITTTLGIFIFENIVSSKHNGRCFSLLQYIPITPRMCNGEPNWLDVNDDKVLDLVLWCSEYNQYNHPIFAWKFDDLERKFTPLFSDPMKGSLSDVRLALVELTAFIVRQDDAENIYYEKKYVVIGEKLQVQYQTPIPILDNVFRHIYILYCPRKVQISDIDQFSQCGPPSILWNEAILWGNLTEFGTLNETDSWGQWKDFVFHVKSAALGDINGDARIDFTVYGTLYDSAGMLRATVLLVLIKRNDNKLLPQIKVIREFNNKNKVEQIVNENNVVSGCECSYRECLTYLSVVVGDFDNDMMLDIAVLDNIRGERECTFISILSNEGDTLKLNNQSTIILPSITPFKQVRQVVETDPTIVWPHTPPTFFVVDYNSDGALDLFLVYGGLLLPLRNRLFEFYGYENTHWLEVSVVSTSSSEAPRGIGKLVRMYTGENVLLKEVYGGLKGSSRIHMGMGENIALDRLIVFDLSVYPSFRGYRNLVGDQVMHTVDITKFEYKYRYSIETVTTFPIKRLDECGNNQTVRLQPQFMIIGFWKCGTTALFENLSIHPQLLAPSVKEIMYFSSLQNIYPQSLDFYTSQFPCGISGKQFTMEGTPSYLVVPYAPERIKKTFPSLTRFIVCVRDPVDRSYSYFQMMTRTVPFKLWSIYLHMECVLSNDKWDKFSNVYKKNICGNEKQYNQNDVSKAVMYDRIVKGQIVILKHCVFLLGSLEKGVYECHAVNPQLITSSLYYYYLKYWLKFYSIENFMLINYIDLLEHSKFPPTMSKILDFIGVDQFEWPLPDQSVTSSYSGMLESTRILLKDFFKEHNQKFYELVGEDYKWD